MPGIMPFLTQGLGYGFLAGVTIGPFLGYVINIVLTRGWRRSLPLASIPPIIDAPIIILMVFLLGALPEFILDMLSIIGGLFVLWLGGSTWKDNQRARQQLNGGATPTPDKRHAVHETIGVSFAVVYLNGMLVNALNPAPYLFWSTVSGPILLDGIREGGTSYALAFLLGYYGVFILLILALMVIIERIGTLDERINRYLLPVTIVLMLLLGVGLVGAGVFDLIQSTT